MRKRHFVVLLPAILLAACAPRTMQFPAQVVGVPQATAWVEVTPTGDNAARVVLQVEQMPPIHRAYEDKQAYIVWAVPQGGDPLNLGTLRVNDVGVGIFVAEAPVRYFDLVVTPESDIDAAKPTGKEVLRARLDH